jgi:hypothetical protein
LALAVHLQTIIDNFVATIEGSIDLQLLEALAVAVDITANIVPFVELVTFPFQIVCIKCLIRVQLGIIAAIVTAAVTEHNLLSKVHLAVVLIS